MFLISFHSVGEFCLAATEDRVVIGFASQKHAATFSNIGLKELLSKRCIVSAFTSLTTNSHLASVVNLHSAPLGVAEGFFLIIFSHFEE